MSSTEARSITYSINRADGTVWTYGAEHSREQHQAYIGLCASVLLADESLSFTDGGAVHCDGTRDSDGQCES